MSRPRLFEESASTVIRVRVTPEQRRALEEVARDNATNLTGVIREAVNTYVGDYRDGSVFRGTEHGSPP